MLAEEVLGISADHLHSSLDSTCSFSSAILISVILFYSWVFTVHAFDCRLVGYQVAGKAYNVQFSLFLWRRFKKGTSFLHLKVRNYGNGYFERFLWSSAYRTLPFWWLNKFFVDVNWLLGFFHGDCCRGYQQYSKNKPIYSQFITALLVGY